MRIVRPRLQVIDELDDGRLVGRGVEVADQVRSCVAHQHRPPASTRNVTGLPPLWNAEAEMRKRYWPRSGG